MKIIKTLIIFILLIIFYFNNKNNYENFQINNNINELVINSINNRFNTDLSNIRDLGKISGDLLKNMNTISLSSNNTIMNDLNIKNTTVDGSLIVNDKTTFNNQLRIKGSLDYSLFKNSTLSIPIILSKTINLNTNDPSKLYNILPQYTIILWNDDIRNVPIGWAPCTGHKYSINNNIDINNNIYSYVNDDTNGYQTPLLNSIKNGQHYISYIIKIIQ